MKSKTLDKFGLPNVRLYEDGSAEYVDTNKPIGTPAHRHLAALSPEGKMVLLTRCKTVGAMFRAPWANGIEYKNLACIGCSKYFATVEGKIFGTRCMDYIKPRLSPDGYEYVHLYADSGDYQPWRVSRIIAMAFIDNPEGKDTVDHINRVRTDNRVCNLQWKWMWENVDLRRESRGVPAAKIHKLCQCLEAGMRPMDAAREAEVHPSTISSLRRGSYYRISKDYNIPRSEVQDRLPAEFRGIKLGAHCQHRRVHPIIIPNSPSSTTSP